MPKAFNNCVNKGGRVRTIKGPDKRYNLASGEYRKVCFRKGKMYMGHKKKNKQSKRKK